MIAMGVLVDLERELEEVRVLTARDVRGKRRHSKKRLSVWLRRIRMLQVEVQDGLDAALLRYHRDRDDGHPVKGDSRGSGHADPTPSGAMKVRSGAEVHGEALIVHLSAAFTHLQQVLDAERNLLAIPDARAQAMLVERRLALPQECSNKNCRREVQRTSDDPMRHGLCNACHLYERRNGDARPHELCRVDVGHPTADRHDPEHCRLCVEQEAVS